RRQQIRSQTSPFLPDRFEVPALEQPREKSLSEILRILRFIAFAFDEAVQWPPIGSAKLFQRSLSLGRLPLRCQHHAPMRCGKCNGTILSALTSRAPRCSVRDRRHDAIQVKNRTEIKPAYLGPGSGRRRGTI